MNILSYVHLFYIYIGISLEKNSKYACHFEKTQSYDCVQIFYI